MSTAAHQNRKEGISGHRANDIATPKSGATEKYAPVLAVPRFRSAITKRTRLTPYPANPVIIADMICKASGNRSPIR